MPLVCRDVVVNPGEIKEAIETARAIFLGLPNPREQEWVTVNVDGQLYEVDMRPAVTFRVYAISSDGEYGPGPILSDVILSKAVVENGADDITDDVEIMPR